MYFKYASGSLTGGDDVSGSAESRMMNNIESTPSIFAEALPGLADNSLGFSDEQARCFPM